MALSNFLNWFGTRKRRLESWRDAQRGSNFGCIAALIVAVGLYSLACLFGGMMGDYGGGTPAEVAQHDVEMRRWFLLSWSGLIGAVLAGRWWFRRAPG